MNRIRTIRDGIATVRQWVLYRWRRAKRLPLGMLAVLVGVAIVSSLAGLRNPEQRMPQLWLNLGTELAGAVITYVLIDLVVGTRQRKETLIEQMGSEVRDRAVTAVEELRRWGWLYDGALRGAVLVDASLSKAELSGAALPDAILTDADLSEAHLDDSNLQGAKLFETNLSGAFLIRADLTGGAKLYGADLSDVKLQGADLTGSEMALIDTDLSGANLEEAVIADSKQLRRARTLAGAILPDATRLSEANWQAEFEEWREKQDEGEESEQHDER